jgi:uncharacterized protein YggE
MKALTFGIFLLATQMLMAQESQLPLITTLGEATITVVPDEILLNFTITSQDGNIEGAKEKNRSVSSKAISFLLKEAGIEEKHIQTRYMNIRPVKKNYNSPVIDFYSAQQSFNVCIKDLDKFEPIIDGLLNNGITEIGNPQFRTTKLEEYKMEAKLKAVKHARDKASALAKELGQDIGRAHRINEFANQGGPRPAYAEMSVRSADSDGGQAGFATGELQIKASVQVAFELR